MVYQKIIDVARILDGVSTQAENAKSFSVIPRKVNKNITKKSNYKINQTVLCATIKIIKIPIIFNYHDNNYVREITITEVKKL